MLLVMTYNYLIFIATLIGITLGYYVSEPLILRGIETLFIARIERRLLEERVKADANGHGERLMQETSSEHVS